MRIKEQSRNVIEIFLIICYLRFKMDPPTIFCGPMQKLLIIGALPTWGYSKKLREPMAAQEDTPSSVHAYMMTIHINIPMGNVIRSTMPLFFSSWV